MIGVQWSTSIFELYSIKSPLIPTTYKILEYMEYMEYNILI